MIFPQEPIHECCRIIILVSYCLRITWWSNNFNVQVLCYGNSFNHGHTLFDMMEHNLATKCTWNQNSGTNNFTNICIYPVIIILKNSTTSSHFKLFSCNWVMRKLLMIQRHDDVLCCAYFMSWMWYCFRLTSKFYRKLF